MRLIVVVVLLLAAPLALANHSNQVPRCSFEGVVEVTDGTAENTYYLDANETVPEVFMETNGVWHAKDAGVYFEEEVRGDLQRGGGASPYIPDDAELCIDDPLVIPDQLFLL